MTTMQGVRILSAQPKNLKSIFYRHFLYKIFLSDWKSSKRMHGDKGILSSILRV